MRQVLAIPAFRRLAVTAIFNELAFSVASVALALLVYHGTGSAIGAMGYFLCAEFAPAFISPLFVARLDQRSARPVLAILYVLEGLIFVALGWLAGRFSAAPVLVLAIADGALAITARVLSRAGWTSLTSPLGLIREANAVVNSSFAGAFMVGPAIGGVLVAGGGTQLALFMSAGLFGVMALLIATARGLPRATADPVPTAGRIREALARARSEPLTRRLFGLQTAGWLFFTISIPVEVVLVRHSLRRGPGAYGLLLALWGAGGVVGSALYARWRARPSRELLALGTAFFAVGFLLMAISPSLTVACIGSAFAGVGNGVQVVAFRTAIQESTAQRWMALMLSLNEVVFQAVPGAGILVGGALTWLAGPRVALGVAAAGSAVVAVAILAGLRNADPKQQQSTKEAELERDGVTADASATAGHPG